MSKKSIIKIQYAQTSIQRLTQRLMLQEENNSSLLEESIEEKSIENETDHTLDHTPILSDDMKIFSHTYEYENHHSQKWKTKIKAFLSYFAGGMSILALSIFGFISGAPSHEDLSANMSKNYEETKYEYKNKKDFLTGYLGDSTSEIERAQREKYCSELFFRNEDSKNTNTPSP